MKDTIIIMFAVLAFLIIPAGVIYIGGAFVMLEWNWVPLTEVSHRLLAIITLITLWVIFSWIAKSNGYEDDRRDPNKKQRHDKI